MISNFIRTLALDLRKFKNYLRTISVSSTDLDHLKIITGTVVMYFKIRTINKNNLRLDLSKRKSAKTKRWPNLSASYETPQYFKFFL